MNTPQTPRSPSRILAAMAAAALAIATLGACSAESLAERAASFGAEQALDGDQDINFDFGGDGTGGVNISTEEGDFALNFDEENGGIVFNTEEGEGVISFDEDGIVFNTDQGDGVVNFDEDGIVFNTDQGDGVVNFDDAGGFSYATEDGSGYFGSQQIPENWPAEFGFPATANPEETFFSQLDVGTDLVISAVFQHAPSEPYAAQVQASLDAMGWTAQNVVDGPDGAFAVYSRGADTATIASDDTGFTAVTLTFAKS